MSNLIKIRAVGAKLSHTEGRTDGQSSMTRLRVAFRNFANAPKMGVFAIFTGRTTL